ncbi:uncharacterized protein LOC144105358 [Amblyomma americanum]
MATSLRRYCPYGKSTEAPAPVSLKGQRHPKEPSGAEAAMASHGGDLPVIRNVQQCCASSSLSGDDSTIVASNEEVADMAEMDNDGFKVHAAERGLEGLPTTPHLEVIESSMGDTEKIIVAVDSVEFIST